MDIFKLRLRQKIKADGDTGPILTTLNISKAYWVKYVGNNTFEEAYPGDLKNPDTIPAVIIPAVISCNEFKGSITKITYGSKELVLLYKGKLYLYNNILKSLTRIICAKTKKRIMRIVSNSKVNYGYGDSVKVECVMATVDNLLEL